MARAIKSRIKSLGPTSPGSAPKLRSIPSAPTWSCPETLLRLAQQQKAAGTGTGIEITRAEVQLANDRQALLVSENETDRTRLQLLKVIGLKLDNPVELVDRLTFIPVDSIDVPQAIAIAREHRAELRAQQRREENAGSIPAPPSKRLPSVSAFANYGDIGSSFNNALPTRSVGASLRIPIFDGGRRDARRAESASPFREESIRTADLRDQIELDVRVALDSLHSAEAQVKAAEEGLSLSQMEVAQAERRYKGGVSNSVEVTDAQTRLARARDDHVNALTTTTWLVSTWAPPPARSGHVISSEVLP